MDEEKNLEIPTDKELTPMQIHANAIAQMDELAIEVTTDINSDRDKSDELYDFMRDEIDVNGDKNPATREAMAKALDLKMKGTDQKIALLKLKAQLLNPNKGGININFNVPGSGDFDSKKGRNTNDFIDIVEGLEFDK